MSKAKKRWRAACLVAGAYAVVGCEDIRERVETASLDPCASERDVAGWTVSAALVSAPSDNLVFKKWVAAKSFSTFFVVRLTYDTSQSPKPFLAFRNDYKSGEFVVRMPDGTALSGPLKANVAITTAALRDEDLDTLTREPVQIEHTSNEGKWRVYQTKGLPEALNAAQSDLAALEATLSDRKCKA